MDRDLALLINSALSDIKTSVQAIATNSTPTAAASRSIPDDDDQRSVSEVEEPEVNEPDPIEKK